MCVRGPVIFLNKCVVFETIYRPHHGHPPAPTAPLPSPGSITQRHLGRPLPPGVTQTREGSAQDGSCPLTPERT